MSSSEETRRLRWRCRRGLLELDVILEKFLDHQYMFLSEVDKNTFTQLLECSDPTLLSWLINGETPEDQALREIVKKIISS